MIRAHCLRVKQHYPVQKNNQKLHITLKQGTTAILCGELNRSYVGPVSYG